MLSRNDSEAVCTEDGVKVLLPIGLPDIADEISEELVSDIQLVGVFRERLAEIAKTF